MARMVCITRITRIACIACIARIACVARVCRFADERRTELEEAELSYVAACFAQRDSEHRSPSASNSSRAQVSALDFLADESGAHPNHHRQLSSRQGRAGLMSEIPQSVVSAVALHGALRANCRIVATRRVEIPLHFWHFPHPRNWRSVSGQTNGHQFEGPATQTRTPMDFG